MTVAAHGAAVAAGILLVLASAPSGAATFAVTGSATVALTDAAGTGVSQAYPIVASSDFQNGAHWLGAFVLGPATTARGAVSSPFHRLPFLTELRLGESMVRPGLVDASGAVTGLELDLASLELSGDDRFVLGPIAMEELETLVFGQIELGSGAAAQTGELRSGLAGLGSASLVSGAWTIASSTLDGSGNGAMVLTSPLELSTALQPGATIAGEAMLALRFVPEPGGVAFVSGLLLLGLLARRNR